jgi:L-asparaginase II
MLALAIHLGAPTDTYLEPDHPVQVRIRAVIETLAGLPPGGARLATDGCSAPTFGVPLRAAALLYARLVAAAVGGSGPAGVGDLMPAARRAIAAMRGHPEMIAGDDRLCTALIRSGRHGLVAKIGAEGVYGLGFAPEGRPLGMALKIADGEGRRSRTTAVVEALRQLGVLGDEQAQSIAGQFVGDLRNRRGLVVGRVRPAFVL